MLPDSTHPERAAAVLPPLRGWPLCWASLWGSAAVAGNQGPPTGQVSVIAALLCTLITPQRSLQRMSGTATGRVIHAKRATATNLSGGAAVSSAVHAAPAAIAAWRCHCRRKLHAVNRAVMPGLALLSHERVRGIFPVQRSRIISPVNRLRIVSPVIERGGISVRCTRAR